MSSVPMDVDAKRPGEGITVGFKFNADRGGRAEMGQKLTISCGRL